ncbi:MAG: HDIG domain-containing protein [Bacteroidales bacterium]|jgi:putative nucleotidyltransferase with HDIG domain|nr:HDIG domain-containing protein [Bacteroidales bacterium]MCI1733514.1 HDIG domain-containing protein [Bacteroidales bacterium]
MEGINIQKTKAILRSGGVYLTFGVAFIIMLLFYPVEGKFKYQYRKGAPWMYETLTTPIDFPILKTQQELAAEKNEAAANIVPYYTLSQSVVNDKIAELAKENYKYRLRSSLLEVIEGAMRKVYAAGILPDRALADKTIFVQSGRTTSQEMESDLYTVTKATKFLKSEVFANFPSINSDSLMRAIKAQELIVPNLNYDKKTTEILHKQAIDYISPTKGMMYSGQLIVTKGETVTADIEQLLDSYKAEYKKSLGYSGNIYVLELSHVIIIIALLLLIYFALYFSDIEIFRHQNQLNFIMFICCLNFVVPMLVRLINPALLYLVPFAVTTLFMAAFVKNRVVIPIYLVSMLPLILIAENGVELFVINSLSGIIALISFSVFGTGWMQFVNSLFIFTGLTIVHIGFSLLSNGTLVEEDTVTIFYLFLNALLTVAVYPFVFLFEKLFYMVSVSTLRDLSDTNSTLMRELQRKAPGTFQHSLQVANLSERAVAAIGGNSRLVRVGAMYHDIGKMLNPQAFIENQAPGINYHTGLTPQESAAEIIKHVTNGVVLGKKYHLPQEVIDYIASHHGHSMTGYFYNVYCNNGGDPANVEPFTYNGSLPVTKEEVVVMMADAVEAASRTLKSFSAQSISDLVDEVLSHRLSPSQLAKANISYREINITTMVFKRQLQEMYHARIVYPKRNQN